MITGGPAPRLIDGRFELLQCLGGGGMGLVWRARDNALHRDVALKEVRPDPVAGETNSVGAREIRARVLREARALAQLRHPNVVIIHHIVDTAEHPHPWLVMELVTGGSLADRLEKGPLSVPEAARIGRGVLSALRAAHSVGILHRDIKPGNVLLRPDGSPVLTDFGIAAVRDVTALTVSGSVVGSPEYIAPERLRGEEGNPSSDLWSLAMMLYVAVEGRHPLRRATMLATLAAVLDEPLPSPMRAGPLGPALSAMLAKDPKQRPNADQFDRMLATGEQRRYGPPPPPPPQWAPPPASMSNPAVRVPEPAYPTGSGGWAQQGELPESPRFPGRGRRAFLIALPLTILLLAGIIVWITLPGTPDPGGTHTTLNAANSGPSTSHLASGGPTAPTTSNQPAAPTDLLKPANARATVNLISQAMGTKRMLKLVIYTDSATAETLTPGDPKQYDDVKVRDGVVTHSPGSTVDATLEAPIDMGSINWDLLPGLLIKAQNSLNVPHPTLIYVIVDSDMNIDDNGNTSLTPEMLIYRADDYGGGYLKTDLSGKVLSTVPKS